LAIRDYDWIAHHGRRTRSAVVDLASERRFTGEIHKPTLRKNFSLPAATDLARVS